MEFRVLGPTEVLDGTRRLELPGGRGRGLLALLVLHAGDAVPAEQLIDALWDEYPPRTASTVIQGLISRLRTILEPGRRTGEGGTLLQTVGSGYRLVVDPDAVDAHRFKRLIDEARGAAPDVRLGKLCAALDLWRGPALADFRYAPFAQRAISALEELRLVAIEDRLETELELGRGGELVGELRQLVEMHPFRERLRGFLMLALYRNGRQSESLSAYRAARSLLVEELGVEPGPALRELEAAILRQDPSLEPPARQKESTGGSWLPRERRPVTVVAVDLTPDADDRVDPEAVATIAARAVELTTERLIDHGARTARVVGDMVMAFFGFPVAHEDDPLRAIRAAAEVRMAVESLKEDAASIDGVRPCVRMGIETGDIVVRGPGASVREVAGTVMGTATRLQQAASDGEVLVGPGAQRLLRGSVILKALREASTEGGTRTQAWSVLEIMSQAPAIPRALRAPMFGRQGELTRLRSAFRRAASSGTTIRATIVGDPGIGKSRLANEVVASIGAEAHAITLRCPAHNTTQFPLRQTMVEAAGQIGWRQLHDLLAADHDGQTVPPDIASAIGLGADPSNASELFSAVRRVLSMLAARRPLIVVVEDLHWANATFLKLVDRLAQESTDPLFLLCVTRPDLLERHQDWHSDDVVHLRPLPADDLERLVVDRAGSIDADAMRRIVNVSQGNPLFAEQLLASYEEGSRDPIPASLLGLLNMRLDHLGPGERDFLRCASVVGMEFGADAVTALLPPEARRFVRRYLDTLERRSLLDHDGPDAFRFRHALIHMAAYQSMTRADRARLHEAFADWLEKHPADQRPELEAAVGFHLRRAADHRRLSGITSGREEPQRPSAG